MKTLADFWRQLRKHKLSYSLILPALLIACGVILYPVIYAIDISFHETVFLNKGAFAGLKHYLTFIQSPQGIKNLANTFILVIGSLALTLPIGLGLALILNERIRFRAVFRLLLILPWVVSQVVAALVWSWLLNPQFGVVRLVTDLMGLMPIDFVGDVSTAMPTLILINTWRTFPFAMLLLLAALQTVPEEMYEAACVDGAGSFKRFVYVALPLLKPTLMITTIILSLAYFNMIDLPLILTGGGPMGATEVLTVRVYQEAFSFNRLGFGSAIAMIVFALNIVLSLLYIKILRSERYL